MTADPGHPVAAAGGRGMELIPFRFWLSPSPAPRLARLRAALTAEAEALAGAGAEPLRWAITAADPQRGLLLEGVIVTTAGDAAAAPPEA